MRTAGVVAMAVLATALGADAAAAGRPTDDDLERWKTWCARCHGADGRGDGPAAATLRFNGRAPRDFHTGRFRFRTTGPGEAPSDGDVARAIRKGIPGSAMPYFEDLLTSKEIDGLVAVVRSFGGSPEPGRPFVAGPEPTATPERLARGAALHRELGCVECHGADGTGVPGKKLHDSDGARTVPTDLTRPWRFRGGSTSRDVVHRLVAGIAGTPMPSYLDAASLDDLWAVAQFVGSLARASSLRAGAIADAMRPAGAGEPLVERGEYLAKSGTCFLCHVQMQDDGSYAEGSFGAGGMRVRIRYVGTQFSRNLTPDDATGLGGWSPGDFRRALQTGVTPAGRGIHPLDMPWTILSEVPDRDLDAIFAYLRTLPPVRNAVPPPHGPGAIETLEKIAAIATGSHDKAWFAFHPGNAGRTDEGAVAGEPSNPSEWIALSLSCAVVLGGVWGVTRRRRPLTRLAIRGLAGAVLVGLPIVYTWPPVTLLPTDFLLARGAWQPAADLFRQPPLRPPPPPEPSAEPGIEALAARGREVARVATCSLCHTSGPSFLRLGQAFPEMGGGMKVEWKVFGTTYSRNLTPDVETGLGAWSDREIGRAITAGISRDGRLMHWQAMPWDHFSNWTPEDLDALIVYLRRLPPEWSRVPDPDPDAGDLPGDSFFLGYYGEYRPDAGRRPAARVGIPARDPKEAPHVAP